MEDKEINKYVFVMFLVGLTIGTVFIVYQPMGWVLLAASMLSLITGIALADGGNADEKDEGW